MPFEGDHLPVGNGPQGDKIAAPIPLDVPSAVPMMALRVADRLVVSVPGEMTADMGRRVRAATLAASAGSGIAGTVLSGLANEYADYFTSPEEYDAQHYEGGATIYGRASADALEQVLVALAQSLSAGKPAPAAYSYDPSNGTNPTAGPFPTGASSATLTGQPGGTPRLGHVAVYWRGGARGYDRPLDRPFVIVQRRVTVRVGSAGHPRRRARRRRHAAFTGRVHSVRRWQQVDSDLGLNVLWTVDGNGGYRAEWEVPLGAPAGSYRFVIQANGYGLTSSPFDVSASSALTAVRASASAGMLGIRLNYPQAVAHEDVGDPPGDITADLRFRPAAASSGRATFLVDGRPVSVAAHRSGLFEVAAPAGAQVELRPGGARDTYGNSNGNAITLSP